MTVSAKDTRNATLQVFQITNAKQLSSSYTPSNDEIVRLGADVMITIDAIGLNYLAGEYVALLASKTYTLSEAINVHTMG